MVGWLYGWWNCRVDSPPVSHGVLPNRYSTHLAMEGPAYHTRGIREKYSRISAPVLSHRVRPVNA